MIAVPLPPGQRCTGQMPPYLWSLQAGEDPGRISSSPILPVPLWEPPLRLCPTGILAKRRPPRRAQPAGPAAAPLICSAQAGVSRGSVCPAALPSAGPQMKTLPGPAARPAPPQSGQPWGAASGPFLPRQPAGKLAPSLSRWESRATAPPRPTREARKTLGACRAAHTGVSPQDRAGGPLQPESHPESRHEPCGPRSSFCSRALATPSSAVPSAARSAVGTNRTRHASRAVLRAAHGARRVGQRTCRKAGGPPRQRRWLRAQPPAAQELVRLAPTV